MVKRVLLFLSMMWLVIGVMAYDIMNYVLTEDGDMIAPSISNELRNETSLTIVCHLPDSCWYVLNSKGRKLDVEITPEMAFALTHPYVLEEMDGLFHRVEKTDTSINYYYRKFFNAYRFYVYYSKLCDIYTRPVEIVYPEDYYGQCSGEEFYTLDRLHHKFLGYYKKDKWMRLGVDWNMPFKENTFSLGKAYVYAVKGESNYYYCFSGFTADGVVNSLTLFKASYNNYAIQLNAKLDLQKYGTLVMEDQYGAIYHYPPLEKSTIVEKVVKDPYRPNTYRVIGETDDIERVEGFYLRDDDSLFVHANELVRNACKSDLILSW